MTHKRFNVGEPILVIGWKRNGTLFPSFSAAAIHRNINQYPTSELEFVILSVVPEEEHEVPIEYQQTLTTFGYVGYIRSQLPEELLDFEFTIRNQYPKASYGQVDTSEDYRWSFKTEVKEGGYKALEKAGIPWRYGSMSQTLDSLDEFGKSFVCWREVKERILKEIEENFNAWQVTREELFMMEGFYTNVVKLKPEANSEGNEYCSNGSVSTLPGAVSTKGITGTCDTHPDRLAVRRVQGETDSFGCEYYYECQQCKDKSDSDATTADRSGNCDWCKKHKDTVIPHRDIEEGSCGPVYEVCLDCIDAERKRWADEDEERY